MSKKLSYGADYQCEERITRHVPKQLFILSSRKTSLIISSFFLVYFLVLSCKTLVYFPIIFYVSRNKYSLNFRHYVKSLTENGED